MGAIGLLVALAVALVGCAIVWVMEFLTFGDVPKDMIVLYGILFVVFFAAASFIFV